LAIVDNATLVIGAGNYFTHETLGQALPTDLLNPNAGITEPAPMWENVGHTSLEDIFSIASEGGEQTTLGTLQNRSLRTTTSTRTETINFTLQQFDEAGLKLYYGANATVGSAGELQVPVNPQPTLCAFLVVFTDGVKEFAFYAPKAEVFRADDLSAGDTESLAGLPLGVKPMQHASNTWTYAVTPLS
jgi:hypothetical protein